LGLGLGLGLGWGLDMRTQVRVVRVRVGVRAKDRVGVRVRVRVRVGVRHAHAGPLLNTPPPQSYHRRPASCRPPLYRHLPPYLPTPCTPTPTPTPTPGTVHPTQVWCGCCSHAERRALRCTFKSPPGVPQPVDEAGRHLSWCSSAPSNRNPNPTPSPNPNPSP